MKKVFTILLIAAFAFNFAMAQNPQLKTYHSPCPGGQDLAGLSYTGYEDEMGNITKHGLFTVKLPKGTLSVNYKKGMLEGEGKISAPKIVGNLKYSNNKLMNLNYVERGDGNQIIIFKYSINSENALVGEFEGKQIARYDNSFLKGKFDDKGRATGWWYIYDKDDKKKKDTVKMYFEQGIYLGSDKKTIETSRAYFFSKSITEQELRNKGFYVVEEVPALGELVAICKNGFEIMQNYICREFNYRNGTCVDMNMYNSSINWQNAFNYQGLMGTPITYMSNELYQNIVNQIKSGSLQGNMTPKYDPNLDKYYVLKADGKSRLYIPLESENEIESILGIMPCPDDTTVTDIDGNTYRTVQIGNQCWMRENLRTTKYADGTNIPEGDVSSPSFTTAFLYYPEDMSYNKNIYGLLYNWKAVMGNSRSSTANPSGVRGICPVGWHVPSDAEWKQLETTVGMSQVDVDNINGRGDMAVKLCGAFGWYETYTDGACGNKNALWRNNSGFSALPAGDYDSGRKKSIDFGMYACFGSSTEYNDVGVYTRFLEYSRDYIYRGQGYSKADGYSVRCVKD